MSENESTPPVACTLTNEARDERPEHVRATLVEHYEDAEERSDGYTLVFAGTDDSLSAVATFVADELQCCSFADYEISVSTPYDETRLTITGPEGTKAMFRDGLIELLETEAARAL